MEWGRELEGRVVRVEAVEREIEAVERKCAEREGGPVTGPVATMRGSWGGVGGGGGEVGGG